MQWWAKGKGRVTPYSLAHRFAPGSPNHLASQEVLDALETDGLVTSFKPDLQARLVRRKSRRARRDGEESCLSGQSEAESQVSAAKRASTQQAKQPLTRISLARAGRRVEVAGELAAAKPDAIEARPHRVGAADAAHAGLHAQEQAAEGCAPWPATATLCPCLLTRSLLVVCCSLAHATRGAIDAGARMMHRTERRVVAFR